jgi:transposase InsO family protein
MDSSSMEDEIVLQRLSVLELAEALENVSEACRQAGISRTQFYEYKRRYQEDGLEGLRDLPPIHHSHPQTTPLKVKTNILELSLEHPAWGCDRLSQELMKEGEAPSPQTIQNILNSSGLGTRNDRWLELEERRVEEDGELSEEQIDFLEQQNPAFRERHRESERPGEILAQYIVYVGKIVGSGKVYLHTVVDTFSSYAFGFLHPSKKPEAAVAVLHNDVLPFYRDLGLTVEVIATNRGREFCGADTHPYELYLALNDIEHRCVKRQRTRTNGFVERFRGIVLSEFFADALRHRFYRSLEQLQDDLDDWLEEYNSERPHFGYRNMGARPLETIQSYVQGVEIAPISEG